MQREVVNSALSRCVFFKTLSYCRTQRLRRHPATPLAPSRRRRGSASSVRELRTHCLLLYVFYVFGYPVCLY